MHPCTNCGSTSVNPIGYCTGCGAFRGAETAQPGYPQQPQHYEQPQSYEIYQPQQPQYGPPQQQYQQPYQQPQYQQPYAPPPQQRRSSTGLVIGIVVGVLVLLIGGGAAVALVIANSDDEPTDPGNRAASTGTPSASASGPADACVIGTWVETQSNYVMQVDDVSVNMSTSGATQRFNADGTGELDMTAGIVANGTAGGKKYERTTNGKIKFKFHPQGDKIYYTDVTGSGTSTVKVDGVARAPIPVAGSIDPDTYTCSGDTFVQSGDGYRIQLKRQ